MNIGQGDVENPLEALEENAESFREKKEQLDERQEQIDAAISSLERDSAVQMFLESNIEEAKREQEILENERMNALAVLEQIKEQLELIESETSNSSAALDMLRMLGEDVSESDAIIETRRAWLKECYRRIEELATKLGENYESIGKFQPISEKAPESEQESPHNQKEYSNHRPQNNGYSANPDSLSQDPVSAYGQYMSSHNWGPKDYFKYTRDPKWKELFLAAYPGHQLPKLDEKIANQMMSDYMRRHNYGPDDFSGYSQDPEWRALARAAWPDYKLPKLNQHTAKEKLFEYMCANNYRREDAPIYQRDPVWQELTFAAYPENTTVVKLWAREANPNYKNQQLTLSEQRAYEENCGACAFALEQHFNGQDLQMIATNKNIPTDSEMEAVTGKKCVDMSPKDIEQILYKQGAGAHLILGINRRNPITGRASAGHWFNVYYDGHKIHTVDGQSGHIYGWPHDYGNISAWCAMI